MHAGNLWKVPYTAKYCRPCAGPCKGAAMVPQTPNQGLRYKPPALLADPAPEHLQAQVKCQCSALSSTLEGLQEGPRPPPLFPTTLRPAPLPVRARHIHLASSRQGLHQTQTHCHQTARHCTQIACGPFLRPAVYSFPPSDCPPTATPSRSIIVAFLVSYRLVSSSAKPPQRHSSRCISAWAGPTLTLLSRPHLRASSGSPLFPSLAAAPRASCGASYL